MAFSSKESSCLDGLLFGHREALSETRAGYPMYNGAAGGYSEWKFKITSRLEAVNRIGNEELRNEKLG